MSISFSEQVSTPGSTTLTTKGDILSHDGTSVLRLPVGTNGQALQAQSGASSGLSWGASPSSSIAYYTKISYSELTAQEAAEYSITNIPSTYHSLRLILQAKTSHTTSGELYLSVQINSDTASANYIQQHVYVYANGASRETEEYGDGGALGAGKEGFWVGGGIRGNDTPSTSKRGTFDMTISDYATTNKYKVARFDGGNPVGGTYQIARNMGIWKSTSAITSLKLFVSSSLTLGSGTTISLYGIK